MSALGLGAMLFFVLAAPRLDLASTGQFSDPVPVVSSSTAAFSTTPILLSGGVIEHSSPTLADIDGDGVLDVLVGTTAQNGSNGKRDRESMLTVLRGDGSILWQRTVEAPINSSPAVADINRDGKVEIVISTGGDVFDRRKHSGLIAFDRQGNQLWHYAFADYSPGDGYSDGAFSSPTLCDLDADGDLEIVVGGWDQRIHVVNHLGQPLWANMNAPGAGYFNADTVWSTAACTDLNDDRQAEIILGADITGGGTMPDGTPTEDGGFLYIFDKNGHVLVRRHFPETIYSSPAVADLDRDGDAEIVVGTGYFWWNRTGRKMESYVYAFDTSKVFGGLHYTDDAKLPHAPGWPQRTDYPGFSSPAIGDLDRDGDLEIVIGTGHPFLNNDSIPGAGMVYAWHHDGQRVAGWPIYPKNAGNNDAHVLSSPVLADVDADGAIEVLFAMIWDVQVYNPNGTFQEILPGGWTVVSSPAVGDTDGDQRADVWIGSSYHAGPDHGWLWHHESRSAGASLLPGDSLLPWPSFHGDAMNQGVFDWPPLRAEPDLEIEILYWGLDIDAAGTLPTQVQIPLVIHNTGGRALNWQARYLATNLAAAGADATRVQVSPSSGAIPPNDTGGATVAVRVGDLPVGEHRLGTVELTVSDNKGLLPGSPILLPVIIFKGSMENVYLPVVKR